VLYKYLRADRLDVLTSCRIRFTQRKHFTDDHELQPDYTGYGTVDEIERQILSAGILGTGADPARAHALAERIAANPRYQQLALSAAVKNIKSYDALGILCLTVTAQSEQMWSEYADDGSGFVLAFDTTHIGFRNLTSPRGVGKVSYNSEGFPTFLGMKEQSPYEPLFRKRTEYSYEQEWRSLRLLKDLECCSAEIYLALFDPACIRQIIIRADCRVGRQLRELAVQDDKRYRHVQVVENKAV
jgi:hypothetical protein